MAHNPAADLEHDTTTSVDNPSSNPKAGIAGLAERGANLANDALGAGREYVAPLQEAGQEYAGRLYEAGQQKVQEAAFYAELSYEETRDLVRGYPIQALGIAAGVGVLIGLLIARR